MRSIYVLRQKDIRKYFEISVLEITTVSCLKHTLAYKSSILRAAMTLKKKSVKVIYNYSNQKTFLLLRTDKIGKKFKWSRREIYHRIGNIYSHYDFLMVAYRNEPIAYNSFISSPIRREVHKISYDDKLS